MVQSKIKVKENDENGVGPSKRASTAEVDHWAFLEDIEAPMWADLLLESKLITEDNDDAWFQTTHPFHRHSARHLRSAFAHPDVENDMLNLSLEGACSPKLPSSVSKSRGKDYKSRDWKSNCRQISLDEDHPVNDLGDTSSLLNTVLSQECKPKVSRGHQSEASSSITSVGDDTEVRVALNSQPSTTSGVSASTITTVSLQRDSKVLEVSKEAFGQTGSLLNALRTNLRKSCATRPASRVEKSDDRESKGRKSSGGKSSVGSSYTGYDIKSKTSAVVLKNDQRKQVKVEMNANIGSKGHKNCSGRPNLGSSNPKVEVKKIQAVLKGNKDKIPNVRDMRKVANPVNGRVKAKTMTEVRTRNAYNSKIEVKDAAASSSGQELLKSKKVLLQTAQKSSLNQSKIAAQGVKVKVGSSQFNKSTCSGKENMRGRTVFSHRSGSKASLPVVRVSDHKVTKLKSINKVGVTTIDSKVRICEMNEDSIALLDYRVHLR